MNQTRWTFYQRIICWALIFSLSLPAFPGRNLEKTYVQAAGAAEIGNQPGARQADKEVTELRTEKSKTYRNTNGTFTTEISSIPINYQDEKSKQWKPIKNKLEQNPASVYNNDHSFKVKFNKNLHELSLANLA